eukprot:jgi/Botrbrau1/13002/Bobra.0389s0001.1
MRGEKMMRVVSSEDPPSCSRIFQIGDMDKLPQELLSRILACLDGLALKTARLVCRGFRAASVPTVTSLTWLYTPGNRESLAHVLSVYTSVINLDLKISWGGRELRLESLWPMLCSKLCRLQVVPSWPNDLPDDFLVELVPLLPSASHLTSLCLSGSALKSVNVGAQLAQVLEACPSLQQLQLNAFSCSRSDLEGIAAAIAKAPTALTVHLQNPYAWPLLDRHPHESVLTRLQSLDGVGVESLMEIDLLAHQTRLTQLTARCFVPEVQRPRSLLALSRLSALQVLHVTLPDPLQMRDLLELVGQLRALRDLSVVTTDKDKTLQDPSVDVAELDALVDSLPSIISLRIDSVDSLYCMPYIQLAVPNGFVPVGLGKLQHLSLGMEAAFHTPADAQRFGAAFGGLHDLELHCMSGMSRELLSHLPAMQLLTQLRVSSYEFSGDVGTSPSAQFLARMPRLRHLHLRGVLDFKLWEDDVGYVACLTDLRDLCLEWTSNPAGFTADAQFRPLLALRYLECLTLHVARPGGGEGGREGRHLVGHSGGIP